MKILLIPFLLLSFCSLIYAQSKSQTIAIIDFTGENMEVSLLEDFTVRLSNELSLNNEYRLVNFEQRETAINQLKKMLKEGKESEINSVAGQLLTAEYIIYGSIIREGKFLLCTVNFVDLETGVIRGSYSDQFKNIEEIYENIPLILERILSKNKTELPKIAVLDFNYSQMSSTQARIFTDFIISSMNDLNEYSIIDRHQRDLSLKEMKYKLSGLSENEDALEMGKLLTASYLLKGSIGSIAYNRFFLNMQLINVETAEVEVIISEKYLSIEDLLQDSYRIVHSFTGKEKEYDGADLTASLIYRQMMHENWYSPLWAYGVNVSLSYRYDWLEENGLEEMGAGGGVSFLLGNKNLLYFDFSYQLPFHYREFSEAGERVIHPSGLSAYESSAQFYLGLGWNHRIHFSQKAALMFGGGLQYGNVTMLEEGNFEDLGDDDFVTFGIGPAGNISYLLNFDDRFLLKLGVGVSYNMATYTDSWQVFKNSQNIVVIPQIAFYLNQRKR